MDERNRAACHGRKLMYADRYRKTHRREPFVEGKRSCNLLVSCNFVRNKSSGLKRNLSLSGRRDTGPVLLPELRGLGTSERERRAEPTVGELLAI